MATIPIGQWQPFLSLLTVLTFCVRVLTLGQPELGPNTNICPFGCICRNQSLSCQNLILFPSRIPPSTHSVIISNSSFPKISTSALKHVKHLHSFLVEFSLIGVIETCAFTGDNFSALIFTGVEINEIQTHAFSDLHDIGIVKFVRCSVGRIHTSAFTAISRSHLISFQYTNITSINSYAFQEISNVSVFEIESSLVIHISPRAIGKIKDVMKFTLKKNIFRHWQCPLETNTFGDNQTVNLVDNKFICDCNMLQMNVHNSYILKDKNTCYGPAAEKGKFLNETEKIWTCGTDCHKPDGTSISLSCQRMYGEALMPSEHVEYTKTATSFSNFACRQTNVYSGFIIFLLYAHMSTT